jgi:glutamine synthetase
MSDQTVKRSCQAPHLSGLLSPDELRAAVHSGEITTVMLAVPDMMGRLKGKRLSASVFLDRMLSKAEACAYILATDVDMTPLEGFDLTGWDDGYGDLSVIPSQDTIRVLPYLPGAALIHADVADEAGELLEIAPRHMLRTQLDKLASLGLEVRVGLESEFVLYQGSPLQAHAPGYRGFQPVAFHNLDYALDHPPALTVRSPCDSGCSRDRSSSRSTKAGSKARGAGRAGTTASRRRFRSGWGCRRPVRTPTPV